MRVSHLIVLAIALVAGLVLGAKNPALASTVTLGAVKAG